VSEITTFYNELPLVGMILVWFIVGLIVSKLLD